MKNYNNILLAEDDIDDYLFLVEAFEKLSPDYKVKRASNGLECITYLKTKQIPDIIFLDLNMPIKSGLECLKFIRQMEELNDVPVIIYSTSHYIKDIDAAYRNGANFYLVKPSSDDYLSDVLTLALSNLDESPGQPRKEDFVLRIMERT